MKLVGKLKVKTYTVGKLLAAKKEITKISHGECLVVYNLKNFLKVAKTYDINSSWKNPRESWTIPSEN